MHVLLHSLPPTLQKATTKPQLYQRLADTHRQLCDSLLWCPCSFILGPGVHKVLLCLPRIYFPVRCKFWQLYGGLMATSSKRVYAIPESAACRAPVTTADYYQHVPPQGTSNTVLSQSLWGPWVLVAQDLFEPSAHLWQEWGLTKRKFALLVILLGLLLCSWM